MKALLALLLLAVAAAAQDAPPRDLAGWIARQDAQLSRGESAAALAEAEARVAKDSRNAEAQYLLGRILGNTGKIDEAKARFEGALEIDVAFAPAWRGMALVHSRRQEHETAVREARKAFELDGSAESRSLLVQCLYGKGERAEAHRILEEALAAKPSDVDLRTLYATLLADEKLYQAAEREIRQILALDADHLDARRMLVLVLEATGRPEEAIAACREASKRAPKDLFCRDRLLRLLVDRKRYAEAVTAMEDLLRLDLPAEVREKAAADLKRLREAAAAAPAEGMPADPKEILAALESPDALRRREAMRTLWELPLQALPPEAVRRITDADETVRLYAVRLLGRHGDASAAGLLEVLLFHPKDRDASPAVRAQAALAVAKIGGAAVLPVLVRALEDPEPVVLRAAMQGIASVSGKSFADDLYAPVPEAERAALRERYRAWWMESDSGRAWRRKSALAAGQSGMRSLVRYAIPWLAEEDAAVRASVLEALAALTGDASWKGVPTESAEERTAALERAQGAVAEKR